MPQSRSNALAWWSAATIFVSAFLLFQVQPVISKKILPWFGGSPAVWTTCVLFFQLVLLGGYAYAHWLIGSVSPKWRGPIHISVLVLALLTFPITASGYWNITPSSFWKPIDGSMPALRILMLLAAKVAAPFFVASTTGPLVQAWFSQLYPGRSPYRLYSLSNVGSLAALLSYPFFIETLFRVDTQGVLWSLGFILFAGLIGSLAAIMRREAMADEDAGRARSGPREPLVTAADGLIAKRKSESERKMAVEPETKPPLPPTMSLRMVWLVLAALASLAFLAITNHLSQDIAVVPFMWVIPLSLYLLSFIICFDNERWYLRKTFGLLAILGILWMTAMNNYGTVNTGLDYPQKFVRTLFAGAPKAEELPSGSALPAPPPVGFFTRVKQADPYFRSPFSKSMDWIFKKMGWVVEKIDGVWQWVRKDRRPVALPSGETFASLDKDKNGNLTKEEVPEPTLTSFAQWDLNSDGSVNEEEFNTAVGKRKPVAHLVFDVNTYDFKEHVFAISTAYMIVLFLICMVCHGELVKSRPAPNYLTSFYLSISAGGALGGLFVALICPLIFKTHFELALAIIGGFIVGWTTIFNDGRNTWLKGRELVQWALAFVMVGTVFFVVPGNLDDYEKTRWASVLPTSLRTRIISYHILPEPDESLITIERNFYGTIRVEKTGQDGDPEDAGMSLYNGRIWHGFQFTAEHRQLEPSTYYVSGTGAAMAVEHNPRKGQGLRVAVIGLGSGSMAAHSKKGDTFRFYDIDPKVYKVAKTIFTYLDKAKSRGAEIDVVMGDARLSMERELKEHPDGMNYDVIHLDAFSGDAIPAHLLTDEAFDLYEKHLRKDASGKPIGIVVVHISNRYLDLEPVVAAIAKKHDYFTRTVHKQEEGGTMDTASDWVLVTKNKEFLDQPAVHDYSEPLAPDKELLWTDQFTALFPIMK